MNFFVSPYGFIVNNSYSMGSGKWDFVTNATVTSCHLGDIEISCSGTLAKCVKHDGRITVCHAANENAGC